MMKSYALSVPITTIFLLALLTTSAPGQQEPSAEELAKKTQNPVADLVSVPLQSNFNFGAGAHHNKMIYVLNIQPVIPISISEDWNLITRTIMPIINQPSLFPTFGGSVHSTTGTGLGDINPTAFLSPARPGELIWGVGPTMTLPTATDRDLGSGKWRRGAGGSGVDHARPLGPRRADEQSVVVRGLGRQACERDAAPVVRQL